MRETCIKRNIGVGENKREKRKKQDWGFGITRGRTCIGVSYRTCDQTLLPEQEALGSPFRRTLIMCFPFINGAEYIIL